MKTITMKDIARQVGVSRQAVSQILNNTKESRISAATREKVMQAVRDLNYRPNLFARTLKTRKTNCIGILRSYYMSNAGDFYFPAVADGVEKWLAENESPYSSMMFGSNFESTFKKTITLIEQNLVDGLIIVVLSYNIEHMEKTVFPILNEKNIPFVCIHSTAQTRPYHNIGVDTEKQGTLLAEYLVKLGYTEPGFYMPRPDSVVAREILCAFKKALPVAGGHWDDRNLIRADFSQDWSNNIEGLVRREFKEREQFPRALFIPWAGSARLAIKELKARGIRVPEDVAIITSDDVSHADYKTIALTYITHSYPEKGYQGARILTGLLDGSLDRNIVQDHMVQPELINGESC